MIKFEFPPNYTDIITILPDVKNQTNGVFSYYPDVYNPSGVELRVETLAHEEIHLNQQEEMGVKIWWKRFLTEPHFRFQQELPAYRKDYQTFKKYNKGNQQHFDYLRYCARQLSSPMYGDIITLSEAMRAIKA